MSEKFASENIMLKKTSASVILSYILTLNSVSATEVVDLGKNNEGYAIISVSGDLEPGDIEAFSTKTSDLNKAIIVFSSNGGDLETGLDIGTRIRLRGYQTAVADGMECHSACALAWLGGTTRYLGSHAFLSFHAAYTVDDDGVALESGVANALVGAYASKLGFSNDAIVFLTSASPDSYNELDASWAEQLGISVVFGSTESLLSASSSDDLGVVEQVGNGDDTGSEGRETIADEDLSTPLSQEDLEAEIYSAEETGDAEAQFKLGFRYDTGSGVQQDTELAKHYYEMAIQQGHDRARFNLAGLLIYDSTDPKDVKQGISLLLTSASENNERAQYALGRLYLDGDKVARSNSMAIHYLQKSADNGYADAILLMGYCYLYGWGVAVDKQASTPFFQKAADQGLDPAKHQLSLAYSEGRGVEIDYAKAMDLMLEAANSGYVPAYYDLAIYYDQGFVTQNDRNAALKWMSSAERENYPQGILGMSNYYDGGYGVPQNSDIAAEKLMTLIEFGDSEVAAWVEEDLVFYTSETIYSLQQKLMAEGAYKGFLDGSYGPKTKAAIREHAARFNR